MTSQPAADDGLTHLHSGKVRDLYATDTGHLLMVASDRISAYDYVLPTPIPDKGRILTAMTVWWFDQLADLVDNHLVSYDDDLIPDRVARTGDALPAAGDGPGRGDGPRLPDRQRAGWTTRPPAGCAGIGLPAGLADGSELPEPIFTPTSKAPVGEHDEKSASTRWWRRSGATPPHRVRELTLAIYARARRDRGRARHPAGRHQVRVRRAPVHR